MLCRFLLFYFGCVRFIFKFAYQTLVTILNMFLMPRRCLIGEVHSNASHPIAMQLTAGKGVVLN